MFFATVWEMREFTHTHTHTHTHIQTHTHKHNPFRAHKHQFQTERNGMDLIKMCGDTVTPVTAQMNCSEIWEFIHV